MVIPKEQSVDLDKCCVFMTSIATCWIFSSLDISLIYLILVVCNYFVYAKYVFKFYSIKNQGFLK